MGNRKNVVINVIEVSLHAEIFANDDNCYVEVLPAGLYLNSGDSVVFHYNYHGVSKGRTCEISGKLFGSSPPPPLSPNSSTEPIPMNKLHNARYHYNLTFPPQGPMARTIKIDPEIIVDDHTPLPAEKRAAKK